MSQIWQSYLDRVEAAEQRVQEAEAAVRRAVGALPSAGELPRHPSRSKAPRAPEATLPPPRKTATPSIPVPIYPQDR